MIKADGPLDTASVEYGELAMSPLAYVGLTLHGVLFVGLVGVCAFNDGKLAHDWSDCLIPLGLLALPFVLAVVGISQRSPGLLMGGAVTGFLLGLVSLTGPGLFVLIPSILYGIAAMQPDREDQRLPGPGSGTGSS